MASRQGQRIRDGDGRARTLGRLIKSGGAGSVFLLEDSDEVAKLYHPGVDLGTYRRKLEAMLQLSPDLPDRVENGRRHVQIAWPRALAFDGGGAFAGFIMPKLDVAATSDLEHVMLDRQARAEGLPTTLGPRMALAANLGTMLSALHRLDHYVVDLKPLNLRFYVDTLHIAMLDCDGFSVQGRDRRFPAGQVTPDYLAPEFQRAGLRKGGEDAQDRFALAVIIFQLLNSGLHPYSGRPLAEGLPTDLPGRIRADLYPYGIIGNRRIAPSPASGHDSLPEELRRMFDRAFDASRRERPAASEWASVLVEYARRDSGLLVVCSHQPAHQHFRNEACAACRRERAVQTAAKAQRRRKPKGRRSAPRGSPRVATQAQAPATRPPQAVTTAPATQTYIPAPMSPRARFVTACILAVLAPVMLGWVLTIGADSFRSFESAASGGDYWGIYMESLMMLVEAGIMACGVLGFLVLLLAINSRPP